MNQIKTIQFNINNNYEGLYLYPKFISQSKNEDDNHLILYDAD